MKQNTKKILSAVVSASILTILVLPLAVSAAQTTPQECCTLKKAISIGEGTTADGLAIAGNVVGAPSATCLDMLAPLKLLIYLPTNGASIVLSTPLTLLLTGYLSL
jgi:hypothetical protein